MWIFPSIPLCSLRHSEAGAWNLKPPPGNFNATACLAFPLSTSAILTQLVSTSNIRNSNDTSYNCNVLYLTTYVLHLLHNNPPSSDLKTVPSDPISTTTCENLNTQSLILKRFKNLPRAHFILHLEAFFVYHWRRSSYHVLSILHIRHKSKKE